MKFFAIRVFFCSFCKRETPPSLQFRSANRSHFQDGTMARRRSQACSTCSCVRSSARHRTISNRLKRKKLPVIVIEEKGGRWHATLCEKKVLTENVAYGVIYSAHSGSHTNEWGYTFFRTGLNNPKWIELENQMNLMLYWSLRVSNCVIFILPTIT